RGCTASCARVSRGRPRPGSPQLAALPAVRASPSPASPSPPAANLPEVGGPAEDRAMRCGQINQKYQQRWINRPDCRQPVIQSGRGTGDKLFMVGDLKIALGQLLD